MSESAVVIVVPCYNEAQRLDVAAFVAFAQEGAAQLLFVDDGSTDGTAGVLERLRAVVPDRLEIMSLQVNNGKAEAVRLGLLRALDAGARVVGYADADLSTPLDEISRLVHFVELGTVRVALGSRIALLGTRIDRRLLRHYLGRVFGTAASLALGEVVYDTQCGAKCFRASEALHAALNTPFLSRWAFDVELLGRLMWGAPGVAPLGIDEFVEVPLRRWRDVGGSKLRPGAMMGAFFDLGRIRRDLRRRRGPTR